MKQAALSLLLAASLPTMAMGERTFGLVIGIDDYTYIPDLHGAVNDAEDIADALRGLGADVTLLTDAAVTRDAVLGAWEGILVEANAGDRLIISYAGHGSNEPEHTPGSERDGRDENFLLAGFAPRGEAAAQRIRDDEIAELLERSADLDVIFVADACHAGTVTRDLKPSLGYRYVTPQTLTADPLPPPPPPSGNAEGQDQVALFLAAVNETEKVPEVLIDGVPRGALSYAFADGLRGAADLDGNGILTKGELETHVRRTVRQVSDGAQLPQSEPAGRENLSLIALRGQSSAPETHRPIIGRPFDDLPLVAVASHQDWSGVDGVEPVSAGGLRKEGSLIYSGIGDKLAMAPNKQSLQTVIDKYRLTAALHRISGSPATISFDQGDRVYVADQEMTISVDDRSDPHLTLLNLGSDGTISLLYPRAEFGDRLSHPPHLSVSLRVGITEPFGADHVVAIETDQPAPALLAGVAGLDGSRDMARLWELLRTSDGSIAVFPFFTAGPNL